MSRPSVFFDNVDELRNEYDWMYEFMSRMAERITNDPDVHNLADYVQKLEDENARLRSCLSDDAENAKAIMGENAKLRELVRIAIEYCVNGYCDEEDECPLYDSRHYCRLHAEARELGVKVD